MAEQKFISKLLDPGKRAIYDPYDYSAVRNQLFDNVQNSITQRFPIENERYVLSVDDIDYGTSRDFSLKDQKQAILENRSLDVPLKGRWMLTDKETGKPIARTQKVILMNVPYLTERGTFIRNGYETSMNYMFRLQPGVYTRLRNNGRFEAHINPAQGTGRQFKVELDPDTGLFNARVGTRQYKMYPLLKAAGVTDSEIRKAWGPELLATNRKASDIQDPNILIQAPIVPGAIKKEAQDKVDKYRDLLEQMKGNELNPNMVEATLGKRYDRVSPDLLLATAGKLLKLSRGDAEPDYRDSLEFQTVQGPADYIAERIVRDGGGVARNILWKATNRGNFDFMHAGMLNPHVDSVFNESRHSGYIEGSSPIEALDSSTKITRIGEGGISGVRSAPDETRDVQDTFKGFVDPIRSPECYAADMEVMTEDGWKKWPDVTKTDKLACLIGKNRRLQFRRPLALQRYYLEGCMYGADTAMVSYLVTGNHRMWGRLFNNKKKGHISDYRFIDAAELSDKKNILFNSGDYRYWTQEDPCSSFQLPLIASEGEGTQKKGNPPVGAFRAQYKEHINMRFWAPFMGWFLAEGSATYQPKKTVYKTCISQVKEANPDSFEELRELLDVLPFHYTVMHGERGFCINQKQLTAYLSQFGKCNEKYIPDYIFEAAHDVQKLFVGALLKGDGRRDGNGRLRALCTTSRKLAEDFHRLLFRMGQSSTVYFEPDDREERYHGCWVVYIHTRKERAVYYKNSRHPEGQYFEQEYRGHVYCATVPGGLLYVRRHGKCGFWCGNSLRVGLDMYLSYGVRKGNDGKLYNEFLNPKTGRREWVDSVTASRSIVSTHDYITSKEKYIPAFVGNKGIQIVPKKSVQYFLDSPDQLFSTGANLVPVKSGIMNNRLLMGSKCPTQALPLVNREAPLVRAKKGKTSFEHWVAGLTGVRRASSPGVVQSVGKDSIKVRQAGGKIENYELYDNFPANQKGYIRSIPKVKKGDKVQAGQLLATTNYASDDGVAALGTNLKAAYMNYKGLNFEDAMVISESAARKLTSEHMYKNKLPVKDNIEVDKKRFKALYPGRYTVEQYKKIGDDGMIKPGQVVTRGDPLILGIRDNEPGPGSLGRRIKTDVSEKWDHDYEGVVVDVVGGKRFNTVYVRANAPAQVGDKLSNRFGGKGVIAEVVTDASMPMDGKGDRFDILLSPLGLQSRVNPAQLIEVWMGKIANKTGKPIRLESFPEEDIAERTRRELKAHGLSDTEDIVDPETGKTIPKVATGYSYIYKLKHTAETKEGARNVGSYTIDEMPLTGGKQGCFAPKQRIKTLYGERRIANIVEKRRSEHVWSCDPETAEWGYYPITDWFSYRAFVEDVLCIELGGVPTSTGNKRIKWKSCLYPTKKHQIEKYGEGLVDADTIKPGDHLVTWGPLPTENQMQLLYGTMLGDGHLCENNFFSVKHSTKQKNYMHFKETVLAGLLPSRSKVYRCIRKGTDKQYSAQAITVGLPYVVEQMKRVCLDAEGKRHITQQWLDLIGDLGLAVWILDDGSISNHAKKKGQKPSPQGTLCTLGFSEEEVDLAVDFLNRWSGIESAHKHEVKRGKKASQYTIYLGVNICWQLLDLISRVIPAQAIPRSKRWLQQYVEERQLGKPPCLLENICIIGKVPALVKDVRPYCHDKPGVAEINVYDFTVAHTSRYTAGGVLVSNSKRLGNLQTSALVGHSAMRILKDSKIIKGQRNDDFWREFRMGRMPKTPGEPLVHKKFFEHLKGAGINIQENNNRIDIFAMTDKSAKKLTGGREVETDATFNPKTFTPEKGGLFSPDIFGPDGKEWGYIQLDEPLPNPVMEDTLSRALKLTKKDYNEILLGQKELDGETGGKAIGKALNKIDLDSEIKVSLDTIKQSTGAKKDAATKRYRALMSMKLQGLQPKDFMLDRVPVLPPQFRPITQAEGVNIAADVNYLYKSLMQSRNDLREAQDVLPEKRLNKARGKIYADYKAITGLSDPDSAKMQSKNVGGLLKWVFGKGTPKGGAYQRKVLGSALDITGRSVVSPNPSLKLNQVGMPEKQAWKAYESFIVRKLSQKGHKTTAAIRMVADKHPAAYAAMKEVMEERPVLVNRSPTLHKYGIMAFWPRLVKGNTLQVNPSIVTPYNMDFDGDAVNYHVPVSREAVKEAIGKMMPEHNLLSARDFTAHYKPEYEFVHGLYLATRKRAGEKASMTFKTKKDAIAAYERGEIDADTPINVLEK